MAATDRADIFAEAPTAKGLNDRSLQSIATGYGRWIGFLHAESPDALGEAPEERATRERIRDYVDLLAPELSSGGLWNYLRQLHLALTLISPKNDWALLSG